MSTFWAVIIKKSIFANMSSLKRVNTIYRITDWLHYLGFALMGWAIKIPNIKISRFDFIFSVLIFPSLLLAYGYSLNDYFDKGEQKKYFLLPLVLSTILFPFLNFGQILVGVMFLVLVTFYSLKGISLKKFPVIGTLTNTIGFMLIFMIGYTAKEGITILGLVFFLLLGIYQTVAQLIHEKVHLESDIKFGRKTTAFYLEKTLPLFLRSMLLITIPLSLFLLLKTEFILFSITCILFSLIFFAKLGKVDKEIRKTYKLGGLVVGLFFLLDYFFKPISHLI